MKVYVLTEQERAAMIKELELEKFTAPTNLSMRETATKQEIAEAIWRRFHYVVSSYLQ